MTEVCTTTPLRQLIPQGDLPQDDLDELASIYSVTEDDPPNPDFERIHNNELRQLLDVMCNEVERLDDDHRHLQREFKEPRFWGSDEHEYAAWQDYERHANSAIADCASAAEQAQEYLWEVERELARRHVIAKANAAREARRLEAMARRDARQRERATRAMRACCGPTTTRSRSSRRARVVARRTTKTSSTSDPADGDSRLTARTMGGVL